MNPIQGQYYPYFHQITLKSLSSLLSSAQRKPTASFPLESKGFSISGLKTDPFESGNFTISFWIYYPAVSESYQPNLIYFQDSKGIRFGITLASLPCAFP